MLSRNIEEIIVAISWDVAPYVNLRFGGTYQLHLPCGESAEQETSCSSWLGNQPAGIQVVLGAEGQRKGTVPISQRMAAFTATAVRTSSSGRHVCGIELPR
jgi:hypothetical protein